MQIVPTARLKGAKNVKGIKSSFPTVTYGILNLFTIKSFRLSLKGPKLASAKNIAPVNIQNYLESDFKVLRLKCYYYCYSMKIPFYSCYFLFFYFYKLILVSISLDYKSSEAINFLCKIIPQIKETRHKIAPIYQVNAM
mgnify:CR=1 FL=1